MTVEDSFSYTFSTRTARSGPLHRLELFAVDQLSEFPLGDDEVLVRSARTGQQKAVPADYARTLVNYCSVFRNLDEHVARLMEGSDGAPTRAEAIRNVVRSFRDGGLTVSAAEICSELAPAASATPIDHRPVVVIFTCDRPQTLQRLLNSVLANCRLHGIERLVVVDDSRSAEYAGLNHKVTAAAGSESPVPMHYFGAVEARDMLDALIRQLPEQEQAIRFLLDRERWKEHKSYGLARNFGHLLSVGKATVVFDDDALCEAFAAPFQGEGVAFSVGQREASFYRNHEDWRQGLERCALDPIAGHLQCLGLTVPEALSVLGVERLAEEALRPAPLDFACNLARSSRVLITECGALGDPGTGNTRWLASMPPASRERLVTTPGRLRLALEQRCCWLGRDRPTFRPQSRISQVTGYDNRTLLPPYFPIMRGEDRLFGQMTHYIHPDGVALDYPWAVPHMPLQERRWSDSENTHAVSRQFPGNMVNELFGKRDDCLAVDPQSRLRFVASRLQDLAAAPDRTLLHRLADDRHGYRASQIRMLQTRIRESAQLPADWRDYLERALRQVQASRLDGFRPDEIRNDEIKLMGKDLLGFYRDAWSRFGQALLAWQDIRDAAREIAVKTLGN